MLHPRGDGGLTRSPRAGALARRGHPLRAWGFLRIYAGSSRFPPDDGGVCRGEARSSWPPATAAECSFTTTAWAARMGVRRRRTRFTRTFLWSTTRRTRRARTAVRLPREAQILRRRGKQLARSVSPSRGAFRLQRARVVHAAPPWRPGNRAGAGAACALSRRTGVRGRHWEPGRRAGTIPCYDYAHSPRAGKRPERPAVDEKGPRRVPSLRRATPHRDRAKRPIMGGFGTELADFVDYITGSDISRTGGPEANIADILAGGTRRERWTAITDRARRSATRSRTTARVASDSSCAEGP